MGWRQPLEQDRASIFASKGYITLAADVYGIDNHQPQEFQEKMALPTQYPSDLDLAVARVEAAVELLKSMPNVDSSKIALIGYCFGGSLVLSYSALGHDSAIATVAFHGSLSAVPNATELVPIVPKVLILSGGEDSQDSTKSVMDIEALLNAGNATWQLTRYAHVEHAFTNFYSEN